MREQIYVVGDNINRVSAAIKHMTQFNPENITHISVDEFLNKNFRNNIIIITQELKELECLKISDKFTDDETNVIIDLHDNFTGLPIHPKVIYLPEITFDYADKIAQKRWDELTITSNINKFVRFKDREVKVRKFDKVRYDEVEEELDDLRNKIGEYEDTILDLKKMLEEANSQLDEKIDEIQMKEKELKKIEEAAKAQIAEYEKEIAKLRSEVEELQEREIGYRKMLDEASRKYDLVGFMSSYKVEDRKRKLIREAKEQGKKIIGVVGKGKRFIINNIEHNENYVAVEDPEKADYWIIVTTPDKDSVELFKELVAGKPVRKSIRIMTLWNDSYPFTAESLVDTSLDLVIPYCGEFHKHEWLGVPHYSNWRLELNNLIRHAFQL